MGKVTRFLSGLLALLFAAASTGLLAVALWLASGPMESTELTTSLEAAFSHVVPEARVRMDASTLSWNNRKQTLDLVCEKVEMIDFQGVRLASFPAVRLKVNLWSLLRGRVLPLEMTSDQAQFWFTRSREGTLVLGAPIARQADAGTDPMPLIAKMANELANSSLRQKIGVTNASIFINDLVLKKEVQLRIPEISILHEKGAAAGMARLEIQGKERPLYAHVAYALGKEDGLHRLAFSFQDIRPSSIAGVDGGLSLLEGLDFPLSGKFSLVADRSLRIVDSQVNLKGGAGTLHHSALWDAPLGVRSLTVEGGLEKSKHSWTVRRAELTLEKARLTLDAEVKTPISAEDSWLRPRQDNGYSARLVLENLAMDDFSAVWPKSALPNSRAWIVKNLSKGLFTRGEITVTGQMDWEKPFESSLDAASGQIEAKNGTVTYLDGMPAIVDVDAKATFDLKHMVVAIAGGKSDDIVIKPFSILMKGFDTGREEIKIPARLTGPLRTIIARIKGPPLRYAERFGLEPEDMNGTADGTLTLSFPLLADLPLEKVDVTASAKVKNFSSTRLVPNFPITNGELSFALGNGGMTLAGPLFLRNLPLTLSWKTSFSVRDDMHEPLHQGTLVGSVEGWAWKNSGLLEGLAEIDGVTPLTLHYVQLDEGLSTIEGEANLRQANVTVFPLNWNKPKGSNARLTFSMESSEGEPNLLIRKASLQGTGAKIEGNLTLDKTNGALRSIQADPFILGRSDAAVTLVTREDGGQNITLRGKVFDLAGESMKTAPPQDTAPKPARYDIKLERLYTGQDSFMTGLNVLAERDALGWQKILFSGKAQDSVPVTFTLDGEGTARHLSATSEDFGVALKGLGLTNGVEGGRITLSGDNTPEDPRTIRGTFKVNQFQVSDAPFLARLFSAVSPFGFADLVTGRSSFDRMKGTFVWQGDRLEIQDLRAPGSVAGINLDGSMDFLTKQANFKGTVVPFSFMNSIIGSIPLIGDVITGGDGEGIIAAAFTVKGPLAEPDLSVNPVSLLTPGFLRNLFFGGEGDPIEPPASTKEKK